MEREEKRESGRKRLIERGGEIKTARERKEERQWRQGEMCCSLVLPTCGTTGHRHTLLRMGRAGRRLGRGRLVKIAALSGIFSLPSGTLANISKYTRLRAVANTETDQHQPQGCKQIGSCPTQGLLDSQLMSQLGHFVIKTASVCVCVCVRDEWCQWALE